MSITTKRCMRLGTKQKHFSNAMRLYMKEKENVKTPVLYFYINKNGNIPLGHSERATEISETITVMRGIMKHKIFSPRRP